MADTQMKHEDPGLPEVPHSNSIENRWLITRVNPKRRKTTPQKRLRTNATMTHNLIQKHRLGTEDNVSDVYHSGQYEHGRAPRGHATAGRGFRGGGRETLGGGETIAHLQAELEWYKRENMELRKKVEDMLNIRELETTLRMTLHSFGVPVPEHPSRQTCMCNNGFESPWQQEHETQQTSTMNHEDDDVQIITDFDEIIQSPTPHFSSRNIKTGHAQSTSHDASALYTSTRAGVIQANQTNSQVPKQTPSITQIELLPSSGVFVDPNKLSSIAFKKGWSYTLLTRSLMPMVFSKEEMVASCVRGERATGKGALTSPARPALDQKKVQAIITFVSSQFPDIQPYQITQTMNQKLVDVRGTIQKRKHAARLAKCYTQSQLDGATTS